MLGESGLIWYRQRGSRRDFAYCKSRRPTCCQLHPGDWPPAGVWFRTRRDRPLCRTAMDGAKHGTSWLGRNRHIRRELDHSPPRSVDCGRSAPRFRPRRGSVSGLRGNRHARTTIDHRSGSFAVVIRAVQRVHQSVHRTVDRVRRRRKPRR